MAVSVYVGTEMKMGKLGVLIIFRMRRYSSDYDFVDSRSSWTCEALYVYVRYVQVVDWMVL